MKQLFYLIIILSNLVSAQKYPGYELSGRLEVKIGSEIITPENVLIELEGESQSVQTDADGNYCFENLKNGQHQLKIFGYTFQPQRFKVNIDGESQENFNLKINADCLADGEIAKKDIKEGKPRLLIRGGIAPIIQSGQQDFEKKYKISYSDFGCMQDPSECTKKYNEVIFEYLDNTYGNSWRKEVRDDVIGLK